MASQRKRIAIIAILVILMAAAGGFAYFRYGKRGGDVSEALVLFGNIEIRQVDLAFNLDGRIEAMLTEEGETVDVGQELARLDSSRYRAMVDAARAKIEAHQAVVARLEAGSRPQEIAKARADARAAEAIWKMARATLTRQSKLALERFASQQTLDDARAAEQESRDKLEALRQVLALADEGPRTEDIAVAKADLSAARAELALAESRLADTKLKASAEGFILTRIQEPGAVILPNTPVYTLALSDPVWVRAYVSEPDLGRVYPGMKAKIITDSRPDAPYEGWVGFISPTAEFTPKTVQTPEIRTNLVYRVRVHARNPERGLRQGMPVTVRLIEEPDREATGSTTVPRD